MTVGKLVPAVYTRKVSVVTSPPHPSAEQTSNLSSTPSEQPDLRAAVDELVRDLIRRDPELWAALQADPELRRQFQFAVEEPAAPPRTAA